MIVSPFSPKLKKQTQFDSYSNEKMSKEEYDSIKNKNLNTNKSFDFTFDPIYCPLDEFKELCHFRRPDIENLGDLELEDVSIEHKERKKKNKFRNWLTSYYSNSEYKNLPKLEDFEKAIDNFIDDNYYYGVKMKEDLKEIDRLVDLLDVGVEVTEDLNIATADTSAEEAVDDIQVLDASVDESLSSDNLDNSSLTIDSTPKPLAPFIHKKYMEDSDLLPLPWQTEKLQSYPFLPADHKYVVNHVFGNKLEDTVCRCIWFENDCDLSFKLRHESSYLKKIEEWREKYSSEELDSLLNYNKSLSDDTQYPVKDIFLPKLDLNVFDFDEFEKQTALKRLKAQHQIKTETKHIKDCTRRVPELGSKRHSKSFMKDLKSHMKPHSKKIFCFLPFYHSSFLKLFCFCKAFLSTCLIIIKILIYFTKRTQTYHITYILKKQILSM